MHPLTIPQQGLILDIIPSVYLCYARDLDQRHRGAAAAHRHARPGQGQRDVHDFFDGLQGVRLATHHHQRHHGGGAGGGTGGGDGGDGYYHGGGREGFRREQPAFLGSVHRQQQQQRAQAAERQISQHRGAHHGHQRQPVLPPEGAEDDW